MKLNSVINGMENNRCGGNNADGKRYCMYCGASLPSDNAKKKKENLIVAPPPPESEQPPAQPDNSSVGTYVPGGHAAEELNRRKSDYLDRAQQIETYAQTYLDNAPDQATINIESGKVFQKWDDLLNDVYQYLMTVMTPAAFDALEADEIEWIKTKEAAIEAAGAEWSGGSGEPMARNMEAIYHTKNRCYYLISLI